MGDFFSTANSWILFAICLVPIVFTWVQAGLFLRKGLKQAKAVGIESERVKKIVSSTIAFSILPSLPILITMVALVPVLGRFIPWLRLSVIGNAIYESMAADMAIKAYGLSGLGDGGMTLSIFGTVVWAMTLGIMVSPILSAFFLKSYDKRIKIAQRKQGGFLPMAVGALFVGMLSLLAVPRLLYFDDVPGILVMVVATVFAISLELLSRKLGKKVISDFAFPVAMVIGMGSAVLWTSLFGGAI